MGDRVPVSVSVTFPAGPIQMPVQASAPELDDVEADELFTLPTAAQLSDHGRRVRAAATDDDVLAAIFGDTIAYTPEQARELGWT